MSIRTSLRTTPTYGTWIRRYDWDGCHTYETHAVHLRVVAREQYVCQKADGGCVMTQQYHDAEQMSCHLMNENRFKGIDDARWHVVERWRIHGAAILVWVDPDTMRLDSSYAVLDAAKLYVADLMRTVQKHMKFAEMFIGMGVFVDVLHTAITMEVLPHHDVVQLGEFLMWTLLGSRPYCMVGIPLLRDHLWFINIFPVHTLDIAERMIFITRIGTVQKMSTNTLCHPMTLGQDAMRGLSGGSHTSHVGVGA